MTECWLVLWVVDSAASQREGPGLDSQVWVSAYSPLCLLCLFLLQSNYRHWLETKLPLGVGVKGVCVYVCEPLQAVFSALCPGKWQERWMNDKMSDLGLQKKKLFMDLKLKNKYKLWVRAQQMYCCIAILVPLSISILFFSPAYKSTEVTHLAS